MNFLQSVFLGAVQGVTEFFPVSSSGHLVIFERLLHFGSNSLLFNVFLHVGTIAALVAAMRKDILRIFAELILMLKDIAANGRAAVSSIKTHEEPKYCRIVSTNYRKYTLLILIATVPTGIIGGLLRNLAAKLSESLLYTGMGLLLSGILLLVVGMVHPGNKIPKDVPYWQGILLGIAQGFAVIPGLSRSGATITAGILCGFNKKQSVRLSYLLSVPAVIGALILEIGEASKQGSLDLYNLALCLAGAAAAALVGFICIRRMFRLVQRRKLRGFAIYCFAVGTIAMIANFLN